MKYNRDLTDKDPGSGTHESSKLDQNQKILAILR